MKDVDFSKLDFDSMTAIAKDDPAEFERLRRSCIDEFIENTPPERQERLRRLQWRIDQERRNCSPLSACIKISKMMWDQLLGAGGLLGQHGRLLFDGKPQNLTPAKILNFPGSVRRS